MNKRIVNFQDWLKSKDIPFGFITSSDNVFYLSGFRSNPHERLLALGIFPDAEPFLVCPLMEKEDAKNSGWNFEIIGYTDIENPWDMIRKAVEKRNVEVTAMAVEKEHMNVERYEQTQALFSRPQLISAEGCLRELRMVKDESELALIREAARLADFAVETGVNEIAEGKTELDVLAAIEFELKKAGINEMAFSTMVLTGANGASPHGTPGKTKIQKGDLVLFDLGVVYQGYCSDITRTVAFGDLTEKQIEIYETVRKAELAAVEACRPGVTCAELDLTARNIIRDLGYGDYFPHRLGHGLGISVHEYPSLTETNDLVLKPGMVFTIEPGIYVPGVAGVRIEDDILVTENGFEVLTSFPKSLQYIK
ncbi:M24 family metallopeptidase [Peribacillus deserti]|uniref:Peptidase M24 family protein n=1 Tax=Peribacillus deserti TaxID=673318 RepID=A0A2N5MA23_9BACI|nr:Xaa-Pro peptidase family protein [Peribacillus deserti]PLT31163.1 peptidase M24 family protein [Peribacillus deserti]